MEILEAVQTDAAGMEPQALKDTYGDRLVFHGGYIAAPSHAVQVGTPPENVHAMLEAVLGKERYQGAIDQARALATD